MVTVLQSSQNRFHCNSKHQPNSLVGQAQVHTTMLLQAMVRTSKSNHSDLPKQLIRTSHNTAHQYLTEISKNKKGVWFARTGCPTKYLDITPIQVTSDKVQSTIDTKFGWQPAHDCILASGPGKLYRLPFISYHVPSSYSISLWLSQKSAFKNNLNHTTY